MKSKRKTIGVCVLAVSFMLGVFSVPQAAEPEFVKIDAQEVSANSNRGGSNDVTYAIDGDVSTIWHSDWSNKFDKNQRKYELVLDLGSTQSVSRYTYVPRQSDQNGTCERYTIYTGTEENDISTKAAAGTFFYRDNTCSDTQTVTFEEKQARYVKLVFEDSYCNGGKIENNTYLASAAEVWASRYEGTDNPIQIARRQFEAFREEIQAVEDEAVRGTVLQKYDDIIRQFDYSVIPVEMFSYYEALLRGNLTAGEDIDKLMEHGLNLKYFERLKQADLDFATAEAARFQTLGADLSESIKKDLQLEFCMTEAQKAMPLIDRVKEAYDRAQVLIRQEPGTYTMLEELCGYIDGTSEFGADAYTCEYIVNGIHFAINNIEKIKAGELMPSIQPVTADAPWLDTQGSVIGAHGGQIIQGGDGKYYWYGEDNKLGCMLRTGVSCYSSENLAEWTYEGLAFEAFDAKTNQNFTDRMLTDSIRGTQGRIERPKVMYNTKNDTYVMWMHLENEGGYQLSAAGVAVSHSGPAGPFVWQGCGYPVWDKSATYDGNQKQTYRDMNVFVDEDGQGYVYYASEGNPTMYAIQLNEDYTWIDTNGLREGVDYVTVNMLEVSSAGMDYGLPSYTGAQMKYDRKTLKNPDGRWSRIICQIQDSSSTPGGVDWNESAPKQREAPAPIKYQGVYYLVTSGCSGWTANRIVALRGTSPLGPYVFDRDETAVIHSADDAERLSLMKGTSNNYNNGAFVKTSDGFKSQSTCMLQLPDGRLLYMGDRWKGGEYNDGGKGPQGALVKRSTYVWLPVSFEEGAMTVRWKDKWSILDNNDKLDETVPEILLTPDNISGAEPTWDKKNAPDKVIDGSFDTFYDADQNGYLELDLGASYVLEGIAYAPRKEYDFRMLGGRFSGYNERTGAWETLFDITITPEYGFNTVGSKRFAGGNRVYRKIRYEMTNNNYCNIAEIKLYGTRQKGSILTVSGQQATVKVEEGAPALYLYAAQYREDGALEQVSVEKLSQPGEHPVALAFEPDKLFLWEGQMQPVDLWCAAQ